MRYGLLSGYACFWHYYIPVTFGVSSNVDTKLSDEEIVHHMRSEVRLGKNRRLRKKDNDGAGYHETSFPGHFLLRHVCHRVPLLKATVLQNPCTLSIFKRTWLRNYSTYFVVFNSFENKTHFLYIALFVSSSLMVDTKHLQA